MSLDEVTICRSYTFEAAHFLPNITPKGVPHKCKNVHGHSYRVELRITGKPDERGLVRGVEFGALDVLMEPVLIGVDHHCWNDVLQTPSVENMAGYFAKIVNGALKIPVTVRVYEGPRSWAQVSLE